MRDIGISISTFLVEFWGGQHADTARMLIKHVIYNRVSHSASLKWNHCGQVVFV
jgi:hypothetical protein